MITKKVPFNLSYVGHERSHEDCYVDVTVRIPNVDYQALINDVLLADDAGEAWVIVSIEVPKDLRAYLDCLFTDYNALRLRVFEHLMSHLDDLIEIVGEEIYEEFPNGL